MTTTTRTHYKVKELLRNWTSLPHDSLEDAQNDLIRLRDRVGMMEWKTRPPHIYVVVEETVVTTHRILKPE